MIKKLMLVTAGILVLSLAACSVKEQQNGGDVSGAPSSQSTGDMSEIDFTPVPDELPTYDDTVTKSNVVIYGRDIANGIDLDVFYNMGWSPQTSNTVTGLIMLIHDDVDSLVGVGTGALEFSWNDLRESGVKRVFLTAGSGVDVNFYGCILGDSKDKVTKAAGEPVDSETAGSEEIITYKYSDWDVRISFSNDAASSLTLVLAS